MEISKQIAHELLSIHAVKFRPAEPFTWASGWHSPIYCDNRKTLAYPAIRTLICEAYVAAVRERYPDVELIAGVATGAIAQGALVADRLGLPFCYVREKAKDHGLTKMVEGESPVGKRVVVVEDLISTGGSSLKAVENLRAEGAKVLGMVAIFTYGFELAEQNFAAAECPLVTLSSYSALVEQALTDGYIRQADLDILRRWREAPDKF